MTLDDVLPLVWILPAALGGLLIFIATSAGTWKSPTRKRVARLGTWLLAGFGLVTMVATVTDAALQRDWGVLVKSGGWAAFAAVLLIDYRPDVWWNRPVRVAGVVVFLGALLFSSWSDDGWAGVQNTLLWGAAILACMWIAGWITSTVGRSRGSRLADN